MKPPPPTKKRTADRGAPMFHRLSDAWHALRYSEGRGQPHALRSTSGRATHATGHLALTLALVFLFAGTFPAPAQSLDARLRQLEKEIAAVRGLEFKVPVQGKIIKRTADASKTLQGYYVPREKTLYLHDD